VTRVVDCTDDAVTALLAGDVVATATDTVYGLVAAVSHPGAAESLFRLKRRPAQIPLQVLVRGFDQAEELGIWSKDAERIAVAVWPGAVTLVVRRRPGVAVDLGGSDQTIGLRVPAHGLVTDLCARCGPLLATSANRHGQPPIETAAEVALVFSGEIALVLDGGPCSGLASTVIDLTGSEPKVLRAGAMPAALLDEVLGS
jgi:L-threonylcarbamoyladenylate synthase